MGTPRAQGCLSSEEESLTAKSCYSHICPPFAYVQVPRGAGAEQPPPKAQIIAACSTCGMEKNRLFYSLKMFPTLGIRTFYTAGGPREASRKLLTLGDGICLHARGPYFSLKVHLPSPQYWVPATLCFLDTQPSDLPWRQENCGRRCATCVLRGGFRAPLLLLTGAPARRSQVAGRAVRAQGQRSFQACVAGVLWGGGASQRAHRLAVMSHRPG